MYRKLLVLLLVCTLMGGVTAATASTIRIGGSCKVAKKIVTVKSGSKTTKLMCTKVGRQLRWQKYVPPKQAIAAPSMPAPVPSPSPVPTVSSLTPETGTATETQTVNTPSETATSPAPVAPVAPTTPVTPVVPTTPVTPVVPTTPVTPVVPAAPSGLAVTFESNDSSGYAVGGARDFAGAQTSITTDPVAASNRVMRLVRGQANTPSESYAGTVLLSLSSGNLINASDRRVSLRVWAPQVGTKVRLKLQDTLASGYRSVEVEGVTTTAGGWSVISLDFSNHVAGTSAPDNSIAYRVAVLFIDFGTAGTGQQFYADDVVFSGASLQPVQQPLSQPAPTASTLLWSEEFNDATGTSVSSNRWTSLIGDGSAQLGLPNYGTGEIVQNTASAAAMDGAGNLTITAAKTNGVWTSARLWTQGKVNFHYGKLEARIKFPAGNFNWPAFWMLGKNYQAPNGSLRNGSDSPNTPWPNSGEIDIAEGLGGNGTSHGTLHGASATCSSGCGPWFGGAGISAVAPGQALWDDFNTFGILWKPNEIAFTFNGVVYARNRWESANGGQILHSTSGGEQVVLTNAAWPFNLPFFIIVQNTIPAGTVRPDGTSSTMYVDWIRYSTHDGYGTLSTP